jgi:hypothetical protein
MRASPHRADNGIHVGLDAWNLTPVFIDIIARMLNEPNSFNPRRLPRGVVEPSGSRRGNPTATKAGGCGVGDLHSARYDPAPSAVTGAISPPSMNRASRPQAVGPHRTDCPHPDLSILYRYISLLSTFYDLRWCHVAGPAEAGQ